MEDSIEAVISHAEVVVIGNGAEEFSDVIKQLKPGQASIEGVRIGSDGGAQGDYDGICW